MTSLTSNPDIVATQNSLSAQQKVELFQRQMKAAFEKKWAEFTSNPLAKIVFTETDYKLCEAFFSKGAIAGVLQVYTDTQTSKES